MLYRIEKSKQRSIGHSATNATLLSYFTGHDSWQRAGSELVAELLHFALSVENLLDDAFLEVKRESLRLLVDPALELIDYGVFSHTDLRSLHRCCTASHFPE